MRVQPADAATQQFACSHEIDDLRVWNRPRPRKRGEPAEERGPTAAIADEQLTLDEVVRHHFAALEKAIEFCCERFAAGEKSNPHGGVDEHHVRRLAASAGGEADDGPRPVRPAPSP